MSELTDKQALLAKLKLRLYSGTERIQHGDTSVTNRSLKDIERAIELLEGEISVLQGGSAPRRRVRYAYQSDKGL